ncbi:hypothetical protein ACHHYP_00328 [Achlya hypogyna]|uniref:Rho-GAP domain-containing protein n=1 Tax=Achlya hypogyna TaxID=1202772 RepID=A0A1V9ZUK3_ACHHY|nr:hypothetical protein ACHHYP_00328 [Achlya hypogyna]
MRGKDADPWEVAERCIAYLHALASSDVLYQRWSNVADVRDLLRRLKAREPNALDDVVDVAVIGTALELQLRDLHSRENMVFPPALYDEFLDLGKAVGRSEHETIAWLQVLYAKTPHHFRRRMDLMLAFLKSQCDESDMDKTMFLIERFAPLLIRDGSSAYMSLLHTEGFSATTECLLLFLTHISVLAGGLSQATAERHLNDLAHHTIISVLFAAPTNAIEALGPRTPPTAPVAANKTCAAVKIQAAVRGWWCRCWIGLRLLFSTASVTHLGTYRRYYLGMTKRVLLWSVDALACEKRRLKEKLRAFDVAFTARHHRLPSAAAKSGIRGLYERYHFLRLVLDYQKQDDRDKDPTTFHDFLQTATTHQLELAKDKCQLHLLIFERHFLICCGGKVENEDDFGHVLPRYLQYKTMSGKLAETA